MVKTLKKIFFSGTKTLITLKLSMQHWGFEYYQVCSNDDPGMTLTYFTARSNFVPCAFIWKKDKTMDFSETIVVFDIKVGRCSQLNVYMNLYEYQRSRSFIDLCRSSLSFNIFKPNRKVIDMKLYEYQRSRSFIDLCPDHSDSIFLNFFSSITPDFNISSALR